MTVQLPMGYEWDGATLVMRTERENVPGVEVIVAPDTILQFELLCKFIGDCYEAGRNSPHPRSFCFPPPQQPPNADDIPF